MNEGVGSGASSLGSLAETSMFVGACVILEGSCVILEGSDGRWHFFCGPHTASRSIGCRRLFEDLIDAVSLSLSFTLTAVRPSGDLVCAVRFVPFFR